jgi:hypothetical protein
MKVSRLIDLKYISFIKSILKSTELCSELYFQLKKYVLCSEYFVFKCSTILFEQHPSHRTHSLRRRTPDLQPTTTLGQYTTLL